MNFDENKFRQAKFVLPEKKIKFAPIKDFVDGNSDKITIRCLDGYQFAKLQDIEAQSELVEEIALLLASESTANKVEAIKTMLGKEPKDLPKETARQLMAAEMGCIDPVISRDAWLKFFNYYGAQVIYIGIKVLNLTSGGGMVKPKGSGTTQKSEPPSP